MESKKTRFSTLYPLSEKDKYMILNNYSREISEISLTPQYVSDTYLNNQTGFFQKILNKLKRGKM